MENRGWKAADRGTPEPGPSTPRKSRDVRDFGITKSPDTRHTLRKVAKAFEAQEMRILELETEIAKLKEENERIKRAKKQNPLPNPNKGFQMMRDILHETGGIPPPKVEKKKRKRKEVVVESEDEEVAPESVHDSEEEADLPPRITRRGREVKRPRRLEE